MLTVIDDDRVKTCRFKSTLSWLHNITFKLRQKDLNRCNSGSVTWLLMQCFELSFTAVLDVYNLYREYTAVVIVSHSVEI